MTFHREHRSPDAAGYWLAWGSVALVVAWAVWWILPHTAVRPSSMETQLVLPMVVHAAAAVGVGWGLFRGFVPAVQGQLALLVLGAALTMEAVALLLLVFPPSF